MPQVSIILSTYNRMHFLKEAIESVLGQTFSDWELIVIDDGSTDGSKEVIMNYCQRDKRIVYVHQSNRGISFTRARAISFVRGEYVAFIDDDDKFAKDKLELQVAFLNQHPEIGLVYSYVDMVNPEKMTQKWPTYGFAQSFSEMIKDCFVQTNSCLVRMECFRALGTFRPDFTGGDDYEMWLRIAKHYRIAFLPITAGTYRWHDSNMSYNWRKRCFNDVGVFKAVSAYGLTDSECKAVIRRVIELTYTKGSDAFSEARYRDAFFYFRQALRFSKWIGIHIAWGRSQNWFYGLLRPYLALVFSAFFILKQNALGSGFQNA